MGGLGDMTFLSGLPSKPQSIPVSFTLGDKGDLKIDQKKKKTREVKTGKEKGIANSPEST